LLTSILLLFTQPESQELFFTNHWTFKLLWSNRCMVWPFPGSISLYCLPCTWSTHHTELQAPLCCRLNVHVPKNFLQGNLIPKVMLLRSGDFCSWLSHEGSWDPGELPHSFCHMRLQCEDGCLWTRKEALTRHQICQILDLGLPRLHNSEK
jgi:hypothetical protein